MPQVKVSISAVRLAQLAHPVHIANEMNALLRKRRVPIYPGLTFIPNVEGAKLTSHLDEDGDLIMTYDGPLTPEKAAPVVKPQEDDDEL